MIPIPFRVFIQQRLSLVIGVVNRAICNTLRFPPTPLTSAPPIHRSSAYCQAGSVFHAAEAQPQ